MLFVRKDLRDKIPELRPSPADVEPERAAYFEYDARAQAGLSSTAKTHPKTSSTDEDAAALLSKSPKERASAAFTERDALREVLCTVLKERDWAKRYPWKNFKHAAKLRLKSKS